MLSILNQTAWKLAVRPVMLLIYFPSELDTKKVYETELFFSFCFSFPPRNIFLKNISLAYLEVVEQRPCHSLDLFECTPKLSIKA